MSTGQVYPAEIAGIKPGKVGTPGQLQGLLYNDCLLGTLQANTDHGVFGTLNVPFDGESMELAKFGDVHAGAASIRCTISDAGVQEYSVEILKVYPRSRSVCRDLVIKVRPRSAQCHRRHRAGHVSEL